jgi:hypothetical protein
MAITSLTHTVTGSGDNRDISYHVVSVGRDFHYRRHITDPAFDPVAYQTQLETKLNDQIAEAEVTEWIERDNPVPPVLDAAKPRYLSTWRATYANTRRKGAESVRLAWLMKTSVDLGHFTDTQMRNTWGMTQGELDDFLSRLETKRLKHEDILDEVGE